MADEYGLLPTGFVPKTLAVVKEEIERDLRAALGNGINLLPEAVYGQIVGITSERESSVWEIAEDVYHSQYPDTADGISLDGVASYSGIKRLKATKSKQEGLFLFGTEGTTIPKGTIVSVEDNPDAKFQTLNEVILAAGVNAIQKLTFSSVPASGNFKLRYMGETTTPLLFSASNDDIKNALNVLILLSGILMAGDYSAGKYAEFAGDDGKQPQDLLEVVDNTLKNAGMVDVVVTVETTTPGVAQGTVDAEAFETGPTIAQAFTLNSIVTPVAGLNRIINKSDANVGRNVETDAELRIRRELTIQRAGAGTIEAIYARLVELEDVEAAIVFENDAQEEIDGRPPKCFECVVLGGDDDVIARAIWEAKDAGIKPFGSVPITIVDSQGFTRYIRFSRPTVKRLYLILDVDRLPSGFPDNGVALLKLAATTHVNDLGIGTDVLVYPKLMSAFAGIPGIEDLGIRIGLTSPPTTDDNIPMAANEISSLDSTDITVNLI